MTAHGGKWLAATILLVLALVVVTQVSAQSPQSLLSRLNEYPHASQIDSSQQAVIDYEIGLGSIKKVRGVWQFKASERQSGELSRYTWQIIDGFTSAEVKAELEQGVLEIEDTQLLFSCAGRACGHGAQWANRVFNQRVLYGRDDLQQYSVYALDADGEYRLIIFSSARTADRQYLHVELLKLTSDDG